MPEKLFGPFIAELKAKADADADREAKVQSLRDEIIAASAGEYRAAHEAEVRALAREIVSLTLPEKL